MTLEEKYQKLLELVKTKAFLHLTDNKLMQKFKYQYNTCDYSLAIYCRDLLKEIGEVEE
jgi:hypothetical protein